MSRITCLIMISGCSALSINSFKFARINVETLSSNAITPPNRFALLSPAYKIPRLHVAALEPAAARPGRADHHSQGKPYAQPEKPAAGHQACDNSQHRAQSQSND